nr:hypothetical protein [Streptomyces sp.]
MGADQLPKHRGGHVLFGPGGDRFQVQGPVPDGPMGEGVEQLGLPAAHGAVDDSDLALSGQGFGKLAVQFCEMAFALVQCHR